MPLGRLCFRCGRRYYRRNLFEAWIVLPDSTRTKDILRICLECMTSVETQRLVMRVASISSKLGDVQARLAAQARQEARQKAKRAAQVS